MFTIGPSFLFCRIAGMTLVMEQFVYHKIIGVKSTKCEHAILLFGDLLKGENSMAKWMVKMKKSDFKATSQKFGITDITARLITNRGVIGDKEVGIYLGGDKSMLRDPMELTDIEKGARLMLELIERKSAIRVIGDYDVDGICSSYILVMGIRMFGGNVDYVLPDRVKDGYGLSIKLVDEAIDQGKDAIITCDNGIAAAEQIQHAKECGMTVIVTDHHEVPVESVMEEGQQKEILPPADAVIDPKRREGNVNFKEICGAVVAYKFLQVMAKLSGREEEKKVKDFFDEMLVFAGIATVCDVMELKDENRIIVKESLKRISASDNRGLRALVNVNGIDIDSMSAYHYGYVIGPCLNATGRLDLASRALALLLEKDENTAIRMAGDLKDMNDSRKTLTKEGVERAAEIIDEEKERAGLPKVLIIYIPDVHESIAGIIAGRIRERYNRPTIILTRAADGGAKGSGRSTEKYDMFAELSGCRDLFTKFGGHKMAAGLSLPEENIDELRRRLNDNCTLTDEDFEPVIHLDMVLPFEHVTMDLVREFEVLEPFGVGNSKPIFGQKGVRLLSGRIIGKNKDCGKYRVSDESGRIYDMMYFGDMDNWHKFLTGKFGEKSLEELYDNRSDGNMVVSIAYYPGINSYNGHESLQLVMNDYM